MRRKQRRDTVPPPEKYDEYKILPPFWSWVLLLGFSAGIILWALWLHGIIPEIPRTWDHGAKRVTPAESIYSSVPVPEDIPPVRQIMPLPEAEPLEKPGDPP